ncbi:hypothetical protein [Polaribacter butkevichii]|uniref:Uncharacterized protein n=1 Tax=Polaribacter butkevichii TaxID=218490 RepID=A0A2P6CCV8_9FLAO|nr:hypothetical protein [Polaribacter butkevichii]PQJ72747.1 hypothetical protein BTO14_05510 [Polaribacter butkevichii]
MELTKDIRINKYRVLADYKVKIAKSPFMSVLQLANEEGGLLTPEILFEELMQPLSLRACENLLIRLTSMEYFEEDYNGSIKKNEEEWFIENQNTYYKLTEFGRQSIETNDFYDKRNGLLEIWVTEENEFTPKIIKLTELKYDEDKKIETTKINYELADLINNTEVIKLKSGDFTIDKIEDQIKFLETSTETVIITFYDTYSEITLADFRANEIIKKSKALETILINEFQENYILTENIILTDFNIQDLSLVRNHIIETPFYRNTYFNAITIPNISVNPKNIKEAREWFENLLKKRVNKYFLSDEDYNAFENKIANEFQLYKDDLVNTISRQQLIDVFGKEDFYKKVKLETIDYLNY